MTEKLGVTEKEENTQTGETAEKSEVCDIKVPALGESISEATVARWVKQLGQHVNVDDLLLELETDKITLEVTAPVSGILSSIQCPEGKTVVMGQILGLITMDQQSKSAIHEATFMEMDSDPTAQIDPFVPIKDPVKDTVKEFMKDPVKDTVKEFMKDPAAGFKGPLGLDKTPEPQDKAPASEDKTPKTQDKSLNAHHLAPSVRKLVVENDINPDDVKGTGKQDRLTKKDVLSHMAASPDVAVSSQPDPSSISGFKVASGSPSKPVLTSAPEPTPITSAQATPALEAMPLPAKETTLPLREEEKSVSHEREERVRMSRLRQKIAQRLKDSQNTAAILTTFNEVDMSAIYQLRSQYKEAFEKKHGIKLGFMSFFVKAVLRALKEYPEVNAEIDGETIIYKNYYDIGVAVSAPQGLVVPVLRDADLLSFSDIEKKIAEMGTRARDGKLGIEEMTGGTFTLSNGGIFGSLLSTPIINPPQTGIMGMHKVQERPVAINGKVEIRPMMYVALSYDHRLIDGREAVGFLVCVKENIENPERLLLEI